MSRKMPRDWWEARAQDAAQEEEDRRRIRLVVSVATFAIFAVGALSGALISVILR